MSALVKLFKKNEPEQAQVSQRMTRSWPSRMRSWVKRAMPRTLAQRREDAFLQRELLITRSDLTRVQKSPQRSPQRSPRRRRRRSSTSRRTLPEETDTTETESDSQVFRTKAAQIQRRQMRQAARENEILKAQVEDTLRVIQTLETRHMAETTRRLERARMPPPYENQTFPREPFPRYDVPRAHPPPRPARAARLEDNPEYEVVEVHNPPRHPIPAPRQTLSRPRPRPTHLPVAPCYVGPRKSQGCSSFQGRWSPKTKANRDKNRHSAGQGDNQRRRTTCLWPPS